VAEGEDKLLDAITAGRYSQASGQGTQTLANRMLSYYAGNRRQAAADLGVSERTFRRWRAGQGNATRLNRELLVRRAALSPTRERALGTERGLRLRGTVIAGPGPAQAQPTPVPPRQAGTRRAPAAPPPAPGDLTPPRAVPPVPRRGQTTPAAPPPPTAPGAGPVPPAPPGVSYHNLRRWYGNAYVLGDNAQTLLAAYRGGASANQLHQILEQGLSADYMGGQQFGVTRYDQVDMAPSTPGQSLPSGRGRTRRR